MYSGLMKTLLQTLLISSLFACSTKDLPAVKTADKVDLERFMGKWYVIANIPTFIEKKAHNATETYTWNEKENRIDVDFEFNKESFDGDKKSYPQKAFVYNEKTKAEWRIQFFWPLKFAYLIMSVAPDYSHTVIGVPDRDHVWIMARTPTMSEETYQKLVSEIKEQHFDVSKLERVPQEER